MQSLFWFCWLWFATLASAFAPSPPALLVAGEVVASLFCGELVQDFLAPEHLVLVCCGFAQHALVFQGAVLALWACFTCIVVVAYAVRAVFWRRYFLFRHLEAAGMVGMVGPLAESAP